MHKKNTHFPLSEHFMKKKCLEFKRLLYDGPEGSYDLPKNPIELLKTRQEFPKKRPEFPKKEQSSIKESFLKKDKVSQKLNRAPKKTAELPKKERSSKKTN